MVVRILAGKRHVVKLTRIVIAEEGNSVSFFFSWSLLGGGLQVCVVRKTWLVIEKEL